SPVHGQALISPERLLEELLEWEIEPERYGQTLANYLFQDGAVRERYKEAMAKFGDCGRLRLLISDSAVYPDSAAKLHRVRWELLRDPDHKPLATSERILFSRFMLSQDWRVIKLRPKAELKALVAVSAPGDLAKLKLADVDKQGEVARA